MIWIGNLPNERYEDLHRKTNLGELRNCIQSIVTDLGFERFLYREFGRMTEMGLGAKSFELTNYPSDLIEKYQLGRCHRFDPVVSYVRQHHLPIPWGQHNFIGTPIESLYRAASQFGLCSGVTFPSVSPMLTMSIFEYATHKPYDEVVSTLLASMPHGQLLALHVHKAVARLSTQYGLPVESNVSKRERDCLELAAQGMRDAEIAGLLGISSRTVLFHLGNARRKLGADNRAQMIARAVALGLILVN